MSIHDAGPRVRARVALAEEPTDAARDGARAWAGHVAAGLVGEGCAPAIPVGREGGLASLGRILGRGRSGGDVASS